MAIPQICTAGKVPDTTMSEIVKELSILEERFAILDETTRQQRQEEYVAQLWRLVEIAHRIALLTTPGEKNE
jgi:hypothetical protein